MTTLPRRADVVARCRTSAPAATRQRPAAVCWKQASRLCARQPSPRSPRPRACRARSPRQAAAAPCLAGQHPRTCLEMPWNSLPFQTAEFRPCPARHPRSHLVLEFRGAAAPTCRPLHWRAIRGTEQTRLILTYDLADHRLDSPTSMQKWYDFPIQDCATCSNENTPALDFAWIRIGLKSPALSLGTREDDGPPSI